MTGTILKSVFHFSLFQLLQNLPLHSCHQPLQHTLHFCFLFFQLGELFFHSLQLRLLCVQFLSDACNVFFQGSDVGDESRLPSHKGYKFVDFMKFLANFHFAFLLFIPSFSCLTPCAGLMIISLCKPTGSNCLMPPPKREPMPAAMISNVVFVIVHYPLLYTLRGHTFIHI